MQKSYPIYHVFKYTKNGVTQSENQSLQNVVLDIKEERNSVDTGSFLPGTYRVNPFSVYGGRVHVDTAGFTAEYVEPWFGDVYRWQTSASSHAVLHLINQAKSGVALPGTATYQQLALQKAKGKVGNADLALGESLGELKETVDLIRDPLSALKKFLVDDKSRNLRLLIALKQLDKRQVSKLLGRTGKASIEAMTGTWLELRYGLRPLVMLVQDCIEKICEKQYAVFDPNKIRSAKSTLEFEEFNSHLCSIIAGYTQLQGTAKVADKIRVNASIQYRQSKPLSVLDQLGLTPRHLPEIAWELTKLSFVWDWIISIGPWLASLRVTPDVEILGNTIGVKVDRVITMLGVKARCNVTGASWTSESSNSSTFTLEQYERTCNVFMSYLPHFTYGRTLDLFKSIDAAALLWQFRRKFM